MDAIYIPPKNSTCETYWLALLEEGKMSRGPAPGLWEWQVKPEIPLALWEAAQQLQDTHQILTLAIDGYNRGGLITHWKSVECFIPASHLVDFPFPADPTAREARFSEFMGRELQLCIIEVEPARKRILLSQRQVEECESHHVQWPDWLCCGAICEGEVTSVRPFGIFVNIGPLEGMVHISEISWGRVRHPCDFIQPGEIVKVIVLNIDPELQRVGLSLKRLTHNPWDEVLQLLNVGDEIVGTIASVERFGIFVELLENLEGLLHISELCQENQNAPATLHRDYQAGQPIRVRILEITPENHRIALGLPREGPDYAKAA